MKRCFLFFVCVLIIFSENVYGQNNQFKYKEVRNQYKSILGKTAFAMNQRQNSFFDITEVLPPGYVTDGSVDYTDFVQAAVNKHRQVKLPDFPVLINNKGIKLKSNSTIFFQDRSVLKLKGSNASSYAMLHIVNVNNVKIVNVKLIGDRATIKGRKGQWGMGISIKSSDGIEIINGEIRDCWGDGIYLGEEGRTNRNILIENVFIDNCRRNGISVISVDRLEIRNSVISNTYGHNPMAGIDIEPNNSSNTIKDIKIDNVVTFNNKNYGIVVSLDKLMSSGSTKNVNIVVNNHIDEFANTGFMSILGDKTKKTSKPLTGNIIINNPIWKSNLLYPFRTPLTFNNGVEVNIRTPQAINSKTQKVDVKELNKRYEFLNVE